MLTLHENLVSTNQHNYKGGGNEKETVHMTLRNV
jgi:hypothetical protein